MLVIIARDIPPQSGSRARFAFAVVGMEQLHPVLVLLLSSHRLPWGCQAQPDNREVSWGLTKYIGCAADRSPHNSTGYWATTEETNMGKRHRRCQMTVK